MNQSISRQGHNVTLASLLMIASLNATADKSFYIAPFGNYLHPSGDTQGFDGWGAGLAIGKEITTDFNIELRGFWQHYDNDYSCCRSTGIELSGDSQLTGATIDAQYVFFREQFSPYIVLALGGMNTAYQTNTTIKGQSLNFKKDESAFIFETGLGTTYQLNSLFSLRGDVRYRINTYPSMIGSHDTSIFNDLTVNLGFVMALPD